jgi:hypothetical protein
MNLNFSKISNNNSLTTKNKHYTDLCRVINWLFITLVLVSYKNACIYLEQAFFYLVVCIKDKTAVLKALGCSTFTTCPQF